jgi:hypothetical protein
VWARAELNGNKAGSLLLIHPPEFHAFNTDLSVMHNALRGDIGGMRFSVIQTKDLPKPMKLGWDYPLLGGSSVWVTNLFT